MKGKVFYYLLLCSLFFVCCEEGKKEPAPASESQKAVSDFKKEAEKYAEEVKALLKEKAGVSDAQADQSITAFLSATEKAQACIMDLDKVVKEKGLDFSALTNQQIQEEVEALLSKKGEEKAPEGTTAPLPSEECKKLCKETKGWAYAVCYTVCRLTPGTK